ncbi:MAG: YeeE/YedE family protein, partial [Proteobacteria bacterium]|nr:YeeE/YedE family protein [Pseudomonadota bacterium]
PFPLLAAPSGAAAFGGLVFGVGMVLAGGCVVGTLYRMGAGNALSAVAFLGLIAGSALYAELYPAWRRVAEATALMGMPLTVAEGLTTRPTSVVLVAAAATGVMFWQWHRRGLWVQRSGARGALAPWKASVALAFVSLGAYALTGMPLGITTCYAKLAASLEALLAPAHVAQLAYFQTVPLDADLPLLGLHLRGGPGPTWDSIATVQGMVILGICLGAFGSAVRLGELRPVIRVPARQYASALLGGVLLALGSRFAHGCNVWYLMGGLPILATQSLLFLSGMVPGAWLGARLFARFVVPAAEPVHVCAAYAAGREKKVGATWNP